MTDALRPVFAAVPEVLALCTDESVIGSDFYVMERVPGAYIHLGNGDGAMPHNPRYQFNDEAIPYGAALYARVVEKGLPGA